MVHKYEVQPTGHSLLMSASVNQLTKAFSGEETAKKCQTKPYKGMSASFTLKIFFVLSRLYRKRFKMQ